jgi:hypothetical protein
MISLIFVLALEIYILYVLHSFETTLYFLFLSSFFLIMLFVPFLVSCSYSHFLLHFSGVKSGISSVKVNEQQLRNHLENLDSKLQKRRCKILVLKVILG